MMGEGCEVGITRLSAQIEGFLDSVPDKADVRAFLRTVERISDVAVPVYDGPTELLVAPSAIIGNDGSPIVTSEATRGQLIDAAAGFRTNAQKLVAEAGRAMATAITLEQLADSLAPGRRR
jgi:regulator of extracellular matrix RemA (YlzA/DUF370 family)